MLGVVVKRMSCCSYDVVEAAVKGDALLLFQRYENGRKII